MGGRPLRIALALALVAGGALAAYAVSGDLATVLLILAFGTGSVLLGASPDDRGSLVPGGPPAREPDIQSLLEAFDEPVLIVSGLAVGAANAPARRLLGDHIVGEDVRLAIRHPAAAERLLQAEPSAPDKPVELVGLGARTQHWQMRVRLVEGDRRLIHLADRTDALAADRIRVDFVANASHELRTPLASLLGFIETLREGAGDDPDLRGRFLGIMDDEARRMERLVADLMSLSRIEAEKFRPPAELIDLIALSREVCSELATAGGVRGEDLHLDANAPASVTGDRAQLSQLLHNVIGNAMKYGRAGTPVDITIAREAAGMIALSVRDQGDGIPPEHLPRLTERFYRVDASRSRAVGGTGLGLAIVKHIVERHRGRLNIASTPGEGTSVTVLLPAVS
ncbi:two-component system, OmpR family, phosphate regulon sensor histidine kinase PhoR [Sphingomonas guangdongensis]|uniref:histidine kinase n=1 Tax=Sphingomonas guangdongensis TaxID=1141890 RepID=A0A285QXZ9_9SPHN|nr:ATP-binding protein [Sphingomonas guangdongensis]SOB86840.1 two-component system, OmpR family, phosphate regulon sensor histidine kinase PhoR [Sphingomonas guangdongensis]